MTIGIYKYRVPKSCRDDMLLKQQQYLECTGGSGSDDSPSTSTTKGCSAMIQVSYYNRSFKHDGMHTCNK